MTEQHDYDQVARWLEGEPVDLTDAQRDLVRQVLADEAAVGAQLDVCVPSGALARLANAAAIRRHHRLRIGRWVAAGTALAAAVLLGVVLLRPIISPAGANGTEVALLESAFESPDLSSLDELDNEVALLESQQTDLSTLASYSSDSLEVFFGAQDPSSGS